MTFFINNLYTRYFLRVISLQLDRYDYFGVVPHRAPRRMPRGSLFGLGTGSFVCRVTGYVVARTIRRNTGLLGRLRTDIPRRIFAYYVYRTWDGQREKARNDALVVRQPRG